MARWHKVGALTRRRGVVYEADEPLHDRDGHKIVPGELLTVEKVHLVTEMSEIRGTWPRCRRVCGPFIDAEVRFTSEVAR